MKGPAIFIGLLGLSRMIFVDYPYTPFELVAPKPSVFINSNYYSQSRLIIETETQKLTYEPFKDHATLYGNVRLSNYYPLMRVIDRPELTPPRVWKRYTEYFFCQKKGSALHPDLMKQKIKTVKSLTLDENKEWKQIQFINCVDSIQ